MILVRSEDRDSLDCIDFTLDFTLDFTRLRKFFSPEDFFVIFLFRFLLALLTGLPRLLVTSGWPHLQFTSPEPGPGEITEPEPVPAAVLRTQDTEHLVIMFVNDDDDDHV